MMNYSTISGLGTAIHRVLVYSYAYYALDKPLVPDKIYDSYREFVENHIDMARDHPHFEFLGYDPEAKQIHAYATNTFPTIVKQCAEIRVRDNESNSIPKEQSSISKISNAV